MLSCKDVSETVTDHLEGSTSFRDRVALRFHLLICKHCRRFYQQFQIAGGVSGRLGDEVSEPTDDEIDALVRKLKARN